MKEIRTPISNKQFSRMIQNGWKIKFPTLKNLYSEAEQLEAQGHEVKIYNQTTTIKGFYSQIIMYRYL